MNISNLAKWSLYLMLAVTVVVFGLYYTGGLVDTASALEEPVYTELVMWWAYILVGVGFVATVCFALLQFVRSFIDTPKEALKSLATIALFAGLLIGTYAMGDTTALPIAGTIQVEPADLKIADMMLYSSYFLTFIAIVSIFVTNVLKLVKK